MSAASCSVAVRSGAGARSTDARPALTTAEAEAMLGQYRSGIYAFIRRKGFAAEEADDLTQETLIRAYLHLSGFRGASLDAWLYRIAANVSVDYLRKRRLSTVPLENVSLAETGEDEPGARLYRDERRARVLSVIHQLPECHQRILQLRYFEDCSLAEIAGVMNCTPLAAKLRVFRAVTALRKRWRTLALDSELLAG
jgi:RNA polymerase sigma-70 factor (ECF subfamily)